MKWTQGISGLAKCAHHIALSSEKKVHDHLNLIEAAARSTFLSLFLFLMRGIFFLHALYQNDGRHKGIKNLMLRD